MARIENLRDVSVTSLSGTEYSSSASFTGSAWNVVYGPQNISAFSNVAITLVNNSPNRLESGSIEFSPDNVNYETDWDTHTFASLSSSGGIRSMQIAGNSRKWLRIRAIPSGSGGQLTGSLVIYIHTNNG